MVWNICQSVVEPVGAANIETKQDSDDKSGVAGINALNKTVWLDDGRKLLVGDSRYDCCAILYSILCNAMFGHTVEVVTACRFILRMLYLFALVTRIDLNWLYPRPRKSRFRKNMPQTNTRLCFLMKMPQKRNNCLKCHFLKCISAL